MLRRSWDSRLFSIFAGLLFLLWSGCGSPSVEQQTETTVALDSSDRATQPASSTDSASEQQNPRDKDALASESVESTDPAAKSETSAELDNTDSPRDDSSTESEPQQPVTPRVGNAVIQPPPAKAPAAESDASDSGLKLSQTAPEEPQLRYRWEPKKDYKYYYSLKLTEEELTTNIFSFCTYTPELIQEPEPTEDPEDEEGFGSGFVVTKTGYITTCAHVIEGAKQIHVILGKKRYPATVIASDEKLDLAILKIEGQDFVTAPLGDSTQVQLAQEVRAIGFPLSPLLGSSIKVSQCNIAGKVLAEGREVLQVDGAINPGNSGGPVFNEFGEVIGVATAKLIGFNISNVNFATPANQLKEFLKQHKVSPEGEKSSETLSGPNLVKRVQSSVAQIETHSVAVRYEAPKRYVVRYAGDENLTRDLRVTVPIGHPDYHKQSECKRRFQTIHIGVPSTVGKDQGLIAMDESGYIAGMKNRTYMPLLLGPMGRAVLESWPLENEKEWSDVRHYQAEYRWKEYKVAPELLASYDPLARNKPTRTRTPFGAPPKSAAELIAERHRRRNMILGIRPEKEPEEKGLSNTLIACPVEETVNYRILEEGADIVKIEKKMTLVAKEPGSGKIIGEAKFEGELLYSKKFGIPTSMSLNGTMTVPINGENVSLPAELSYSYQDPVVLKQQRDEAVIAQREEAKNWYPQDPQRLPKTVEPKGKDRVPFEFRSGFFHARHRYDIECRRSPTQTLFSPDGKRLLIAFGREHDLILVDTETWEQYTLPDKKRQEPLRIHSLAFSGDGERIAIGTEYGGIVAWQITSAGKLEPIGEAKGTLQGKVSAVTMNADGTRVLAVDGRGSLSLFSLEKMQEIDTLSLGPLEHNGYALALDPTGRRALVASVRAVQQITFDPDSKPSIVKTIPLEEKAMVFGFTSNLRQVLCQCNKGLMLASTKDGSFSEPMDIPSGTRKGLLPSSDGSYLLALETNNIRVYNPSTGKYLGLIQVEHSASIDQLYHQNAAISPDGKTIALAYSKGVRILQMTLED